MWWKLKEVDTHVELHLFLIVDVQFFVGIDGHNQRANVGLKEWVQMVKLIVKMHFLTTEFKKSIPRLT